MSTFHRVAGVRDAEKAQHYSGKLHITNHTAASTQASLMSTISTVALTQLPASWRTFNRPCFHNMATLRSPAYLSLSVANCLLTTDAQRDSLTLLAARATQ